MQPRYLLDEHISPQVAEILAKHGWDARAVAASELMGMADPDLLKLAAKEKRIFVTYDTATVPVAFSELFRAGSDIPGLVLVDSKTIPSNEISGLARALGRLAGRIEKDEVDVSGGVFLQKR